ncbi:MAG TPA: IS1182 family transposase [bacterium]|jgi:transposase
MEPPGVRVLKPCRNQLQMRSVELDSLLAADHPARIVWAFVEKLDLSALYAQIKAAGAQPGRPAIDPAVLMALWLVATLDGVGSARALDRLCGEHDAYRWICGGVEVNYHTLSDFRVHHVKFLDGVLTRSVAALMLTGSVTLNRVAQDGVRVRASAGSGSFRRRKRLQEFMKLAEDQVRRLREELEQDPSATSKRQQAARQRVAREREERVGQALREMEKIENDRRWRTDKGNPRKTPRDDSDKSDRRKEPRVSATDPQARVMKGPDGGFRPSYNAQFSTDTASQIIVGVAVTNDGTDWEQLPPMTAQLRERYGRCPAETLADGGFARLDAIARTSALGSTVFAPVPAPANAKLDPHQPRPGEPAALAEWRTRMGTEDAKRIYRQRAASAECINAQARNRGLRQFLVRGMEKVRAVLLWYALAHNLMRAARPIAAPAAA